MSNPSAPSVTMITGDDTQIYTGLTATAGQILVASNTTDVASGAASCTFVPTSTIPATAAAIVNDTTTNASMYPVWVTTTTGNLPLKVSSTKLSFNPSTGTLTSTAFVGNLTGNVTGNTSGTAATVTTAAQPAITSVGTLTGLTVSGNVTTSGLFLNPITPVTVANAGTVALSTTVSQNVLRPTSDTTIAAAEINMPTTPVDGQVCNVISTGTITTVTGTFNTDTLPAQTTILAGTNIIAVYNTTATKWFIGT